MYIGRASLLIARLYIYIIFLSSYNGTQQYIYHISICFVERRLRHMYLACVARLLMHLGLAGRSCTHGWCRDAQHERYRVATSCTYVCTYVRTYVYTSL